MVLVGAREILDLGLIHTLQLKKVLVQFGPLKLLSLALSLSVPYVTSWKPHVCFVTSMWSRQNAETAQSYDFVSKAGSVTSNLVGVGIQVGLREAFFDCTSTVLGSLLKWAFINNLCLKLGNSCWCPSNDGPSPKTHINVNTTLGIRGLSKTQKLCRSWRLCETNHNTKSITVSYSTYRDTSP